MSMTEFTNYVTGKYWLSSVGFVIDNALLEPAMGNEGQSLVEENELQSGEMFRIVRGDMAEPSAFVVLRVAPAVLDLPNVVITDANASSEYVAFHPSPDGLAVLDCALVLARVWTSDDPFEYYRRKSAICAEVLVPDAVTSRWISGAYVSGNVTSERLRPVAGEFAALDITVNPDIFFL